MYVVNDVDEFRESLMTRTAAFAKSNVSAISLAVAALAISRLAFAQDASAPKDIELDFRFLAIGDTRQIVLAKLGPPNGEAETTTLAVKQHRLMWVGPGGRKFVASFLFNRLWRSKVCSASVADC